MNDKMFMFSTHKAAKHHNVCLVVEGALFMSRHFSHTCECFQYAEDLAASHEIYGFCSSKSLCEEFLDLKLSKESEILDICCGPGNVGQIVSIAQCTVFPHFGI